MSSTGGKEKQCLLAVKFSAGLLAFQMLEKRQLHGWRQIIEEINVIPKA